MMQIIRPNAAVVTVVETEVDADDDAVVEAVLDADEVALDARVVVADDEADDEADVVAVDARVVVAVELPVVDTVERAVVVAELLADVVADVVAVVVIVVLAVVDTELLPVEVADDEALLDADVVAVDAKVVEAVELTLVVADDEAELVAVVEGDVTAQAMKLPSRKLLTAAFRESTISAQLRPAITRMDPSAAQENPVGTPGNWVASAYIRLSPATASSHASPSTAVMASSVPQANRAALALHGSIVSCSSAICSSQIPVRAGTRPMPLALQPNLLRSPLVTVVVALVEADVEADEEADVVAVETTVVETVDDAVDVADVDTELEADELAVELTVLVWLVTSQLIKPPSSVSSNATRSADNWDRQVAASAKS